MEPTYDVIGAGYDGGRRPDPRIQGRLDWAIGRAGRVVDIGTGSGNYSPADRFCLGVDPSQLMLDARRLAGRRRSVQARAEVLPFDSDSFDCSLGVLTAHHWSDLHAGLEEMARTSSKQVLFIREPFRASDDFWLLDYFPSILEVEAAKNYPTVDEIGRTLSIDHVEDVPVPADCVDGFLGCYWNRPEAFLQSLVRRCISIFSFISDDEETDGVDRLRNDLKTGRWDAHYGDLRSRDEYSVGHRLVIAA